MGTKIIAIDFDGTLVENRWPEIGKPKQRIINRLKEEIHNGARVILWTCRAGEPLTEAIAFCAHVGIHLDAVNDNLPDLTKKFGSNSRKIVATEYWDDRAVKIH